MKWNKKYHRWAVEIALILIVITAIRFWLQRDAISGIAPNINAIMLNGKNFDLYKEKSRPVLLHFWASWCPVCTFEQSNIENLSKDFSVITVAMQSGTNDELRQYMKKERLSFNVINDDNGVLSKIYKVSGVPVSFIINKANKIEFIEVGYTTELGLRARLWWAGLSF